MLFYTSHYCFSEKAEKGAKDLIKKMEFNSLENMTQVPTCKAIDRPCEFSQEQKYEEQNLISFINFCNSRLGKEIINKIDSDDYEESHQKRIALK